MFGKSKSRYKNPLHLIVCNFTENCHIFTFEVFLILLIVSPKTSVYVCIPCITFQISYYLVFVLNQSRFDYGASSH